MEEEYSEYSSSLILRQSSLSQQTDDENNPSYSWSFYMDTAVKAAALMRESLTDGLNSCVRTAIKTPIEIIRYEINHPEQAAFVTLAYAIPATAAATITWFCYNEYNSKWAVAYENNSTLVREMEKCWRKCEAKSSFPYSDFGSFVTAKKPPFNKPCC